MQRRNRAFLTQACIMNSFRCVEHEIDDKLSKQSQLINVF